MPSAFADSAIKYILEERDIALLELDESDLPTPIGEPTEDQLKSYYDDNIDLFSLPESKSITYAILTPDMMVETIPVEDSDLLALYEKNIDTYKKPERRLVERLNFLDYEDAQRAAQRLQSGEVDFEGLVSERGLTLGDIDLGDVTLEELSDAGETVFALSSGAITAPLKTDLGAAIYRVNGILNAQETPFDEVKANESDMRLETTIYYDGVENDISAYAAFRSAAAGLQETDFPAIIRLADGGILAMRLEEILPTRPEDFTQVRDNVQALWRDSVLRDALGTLGKETLSRAEAGENLVDLGSKFKTMSSLKRNGSTSDASPLVIARAFELDEGTFGQVDGVDSVYVIQLLGISDGDSTTEEARSIEDAFASQLDQGLASDLFQIFVSQVQQSAGVSLNEQALNAVHTNFQ
ncbi:MAG: peptidyl-prolyl cis-trans isomerase [Rhodobacteraceae bacterium]|nr:peptidyl-prolyl cis-trans isomerase [Paracoccaceae bacterium]